MFGPSVQIYLTPFMGLSRRPSSSGPMDGDLRRTIYVEVRRNFLSPMMLAFDLPLPDSTSGRRTVSNLPAQSLILMNDPFVVEQAEAWGKRMALDFERTEDARIVSIYETALNRRPETWEIDRLKAFASVQAQSYGLDDGSVWKDGRIWRDLCHVMFTLKEFIYIG